MKVVVDDKIPYIREALQKIADEVVYLPGKEIDNNALKDADALIIRTRTKCNRKLLQGTNVKFIATATIGFDHIDVEYLKEAGITWTNCPGCNSASVAQYLHSSLLLLQQERGVILRGATLGIVGVGNVGRKVAKVAEELGMKVLLNDLPREANEGSAAFNSLLQLAAISDIITFHVPLNKDGRYKTFHLADEAFFRQLKKKPVLINTSRGAVVDNEALLKALEQGWIRDAVIDVWEGEPQINRTLLNKVYLGTPHIAGYSADGKANATRMSLKALCQFFHIQADFHIEPPLPENLHSLSSDTEKAFIEMYDPRKDSEALKSYPEQFEQLRGDYYLRRERTAYNR